MAATKGGGTRSCLQVQIYSVRRKLSGVGAMAQWGSEASEAGSIS